MHVISVLPSVSSGSRSHLAVRRTVGTGALIRPPGPSSAKQYPRLRAVLMTIGTASTEAGEFLTPSCWSTMLLRPGRSCRRIA